MSLPLLVAIENAIYRLEHVLPGYADGTLTVRDLPHGLGVLFRQLGTCRMLAEGDSTPWFTSQMQAASGYLFRLPALADDEKVTSLAGCWWDAIAGGYWEAAREIARLSRTSHNPDREHEDDFLYVMFLMQRFFLAPDPSDADAREAFEQQLSARLARWRIVLEGTTDPKIDLCEALQQQDHDAFQEALVAVGEHRRAWLERVESEEALEKEVALWMKPVWPEGLALLRLAELDGLGTDFDCPGVPPLVRIPPPFRYDANAWRDLEFKPFPR